MRLNWLWSMILTLITMIFHIIDLKGDELKENSLRAAMEVIENSAPNKTLTKKVKRTFSARVNILLLLSFGIVFEETKALGADPN